MNGTSVSQHQIPGPVDLWKALQAWKAVAKASAKCKLVAVQEISQVWGGECLSDNYHHSRLPLQFRCAHGHVFARTTSKLIEGIFCPVCQGTRARKLLQCQEWASQHSWTCLSERYVNSSTPLHWRCEHGHEWLATTSALKQTPGCPRCHGRRRRHSIAAMQALAKDRGGACLSFEYINTHHKLAWVCHRGHHWMATPNSAIRGHWCKQCDIIERIGKRYKKRLKYEPM